MMMQCLLTKHNLNPVFSAFGVFSGQPYMELQRWGKKSAEAIPDWLLDPTLRIETTATTYACLAPPRAPARRSWPRVLGAMRVHSDDDNEEEEDHEPMLAAAADREVAFADASKDDQAESHSVVVVTTDRPSSELAITTRPRFDDARTPRGNDLATHACAGVAAAAAVTATAATKRTGTHRSTGANQRTPGFLMDAPPPPPITSDVGDTFTMVLSI
jgi:hypothetical protein